MHGQHSLTTAIQPIAASHSLRAGILFLFCAGLVLFLPFLSNVLLYAIVLVLLVCWVAPMWLDVQQGRFDPFESIHVMGLRYFAFFGLGAIWTYQDPARVGYDKYVMPYLTEATFYCLLGYLALVAGYYGPWFRPKPRERFEESPASLTLVLVPGLLGFVGSIAAALWARAAWAGISLPGIFSSLSQLSPLFHFGWALCWLLVFSKFGTPRQRLFLLAVFVPATAMILFASLTDKSLAGTLAAVPLIALWYAHGKLPWRTLLILALLLVFVVFPFFNTYRWLDPQISIASRAAMTGRIISHWDSDTFLSASLVSVKRRLALVNSVAVVVRDTGRWVPYAEGRTLFMPAMAIFIPRMIWPDKPSFALGREFGETFRIVSVLDEKTSVAATVPGELYWNYDLPGVILGMALWGAVLRFFYRRYGQAAGLDPVRRAIHIVILIQFVHFGGGLAAQVILLIRTLILLEAFLWIARRAGLIRMRPVDL
jgi:hypothetical protein